jgi:hypothetical protein
MADEPRSSEQRKADALAKLSAPVPDVWVATGDAYLIPLTLAWTGDRIVLATGRSARTTRNLAARPTARLALGPTRDVVMIDATLDQVVPVAGADALGEAFAAQNDWDPRTAGDDYVFLVLRPDRIQAWREENELPGRTVMRDGIWLV